MNYQEFLKSKVVEIKPSGFDVENINPKLFDFQKAIVKWSLKRGKACIFADTGLGKTMMQVEWAKQILNRYPDSYILILAPLAVSQQTIEEAKKIDIDIVYANEQSDLNAPGIYVTNYERIDKFIIKDLKAIVLDESSILKHEDSKTRTKIIDLCINIPYKLSCTATPSPNDYMELASQSEFLGVMDTNEMLATFFTHDSSMTSKWRLKGHAKVLFFEWLATWSTFVKKPSDIGDYNDDGYILPKLNVIQHTVKSGLNIDNYQTDKGQLGMSGRLKARRDTLKQRCEFASNIINQSEDIFLVWCNMNDESSTLNTMIEDSLEVRGSQTLEQKENNIMKFTHSESRVLITKPSIAGFGMNWQHCSNMVFVGLNDSYEDLYQAIRRCWRFGQEKEVNVHIVVSDLEGQVVENIKRKDDQMNELQAQMIARMSDFQKREISGLVRDEYDYQKDDLKGDNFHIMLGDSCERLKELADESVDYSIFSPPFPNVYVYTNSNRDLGNAKDNKEFDVHFEFIAKELYRTLRTGRVISIHCMNTMLSKSRHGKIGIHDFRGDIIRLFENVGFTFHSEVTIWKNPVVAMQRTKALGLLWKQIKKDSARCRQGLPDYVLTFAKGDGALNTKPVSHTPEEFPVDIWQQYASPCWNDINQSNTLNYRIARTESDERHIAPLQLDLISRCIDLWSAKDDIVLSPFMGIGSEGYVSLLKGRKFVGVELKDSYFVHAKNNIIDANKEYGIASKIGDIVAYNSIKTHQDVKIDDNKIEDDQITFI